MIERNFGFLYEGNLEYLAKGDIQSLEQFFKNVNFSFTFNIRSSSLSIGDSVIERMKNLILNSEETNIDEKIVVMDQYLKIINLRTDLDSQIIIQSYCDYADLLMRVKKEELDYDTIEREMIQVEKFCRKESFDLVEIFQSVSTSGEKICSTSSKRRKRGSTESFEPDRAYIRKPSGQRSQ